jgi:hypothetical protein
MQHRCIQPVLRTNAIQTGTPSLRFSVTKSKPVQHVELGKSCAVLHSREGILARVLRNHSAKTRLSRIKSEVQTEILTARFPMHWVPISRFGS